MPSSAVRTFTDPDDWTTTFRGSQAQLTITARGQFSAKLTWIRLHRLQMQRFFDNLPRILHVAHVHRRATISFLAPQGPPQRWGGIELALGDIMLHNLDQSHFQQTSGVASSGFISLPVEVNRDRVGRFNLRQLARRQISGNLWGRVLLAHTAG